MRSTNNHDSRCQAIVADGTLQPYIDDYLARCPDAGVGVEVVSTLAWYRQHMKAPTVEQVVSKTIVFLKKFIGRVSRSAGLPQRTPPPLKSQLRLPSANGRI